MGFAEQVGKALAHLHDPSYLQVHPLTRLQTRTEVVAGQSSRGANPGQALRRSLEDAVDALRPAQKSAETSHAWRGYEILRLRYIEALDVKSVWKALSLGKSEYYRDHNQAVEAVAALLRERWGLLASEGTAEPTDPSRETRSVRPPPNNLPHHLTSFVGRERESLEVKRLLATTRLLTVTGPGGSGKTRLGLKVAAELLEECPDGVYVVELAPLSDPELVPETVAAALGLHVAPDQPVLDALLAFLEERRLLLILDNCEHLLDGAARLAEGLLRGCPSLRIVATSREALGITGETAWQIPPLSLPDSDRLPVERLLGYEAVRLFVERARATRPDFAVSELNAAAVVRVCRRLDGMPLALELAAARVRAVSVDQLAQRLHDRFHLLTSGSRTALPRQQTLRATIDWSYELLSEPERVLLARLSVFAGGWTLEACEGVCAGDGLADEDILDLLTRLADKSMVAVFEAGPEEPRYRLLETIRQYARERLRVAGDEVAVRDRHGDWYLDLVERAEPELVGPREGEWLDRLDREHDNLRAVLEWCLASAPQVALRVAGGLWWFWNVRGYYTEARRWLEDALRRAPEPTAYRAKALVGAGALAAFQADQPRGYAYLQESVEIARAMGDDDVLARGLTELGIIVFNGGDYARAYTLLEESVAAARRAGSHSSSALWALNRLGVAAHLAGDLERAKALFEEGVALAREAGSKRNLGWALGDLGELLASLGDHESARPLLEEALETSRDVGDRQGLPWRLLHLGNLVRIQQEHDWARDLLEEARERFQILKINFGVVQVLTALANLERSLGDRDQAVDLLRESLGPSLPVHDRRIVSHRIWLMGVVEVERGAHARGVRLIGAGVAHGLYRTFLFSSDESAAEVARDLASSALGEEAFSRAWAEGQAMTLEEAVEYALQEK